MNALFFIIFCFFSAIILSAMIESAFIKDELTHNTKKESNSEISQTTRKSNSEISLTMKKTIGILINNRKKLYREYQKLNLLGEKKKKQKELLKNIAEIDKAIAAVSDAYNKMPILEQSDKDYLIKLLLNIIAEYPLNIKELLKNE